MKQVKVKKILRKNKRTDLTQLDCIFDISCDSTAKSIENQFILYVEALRFSTLH